MAFAITNLTETTPTHLQPFLTISTDAARESPEHYGVQMEFHSAAVLVVINVLAQWVCLLTGTCRRAL